jgi:hypothetical protein
LEHDAKWGTANDLLKPFATLMDTHTIAVTFTGKARNELIWASPSINWDLKVIVDTAGEFPVVQVFGAHDGFPAYEIYVNNRTVYQFAPAGLTPDHIPVVAFNDVDISGLFFSRPTDFWLCDLKSNVTQCIKTPQP